MAVEVGPGAGLDQAEDLGIETPRVEVPERQRWDRDACRRQGDGDGERLRPGLLAGQDDDEAVAQGDAGEQGLLRGIGDGEVGEVAAGVQVGADGQAARRLHVEGETFAPAAGAEERG